MDNNVGVTLELENVAKRGQKNHAFGTHKSDLFPFMFKNVQIMLHNRIRFAERLIDS